MTTLAIETSGREGSIALIDCEKVIDTQSLCGQGQRHAQSLIAEIDNMLKKHNLTPNDCKGIAVSIGPGSFTGLRVGVVCAKTFAYATGCQLAAVDTFQAIANNSPSDVTEVHVISNAQRGELFWGKYIRGDDGCFVMTNDVSIISPEEFIKLLSKESVITGTGVNLIKEDVENHCQILSEEDWLPTASHIGLLGERMIQQQATVSAWELVPKYLRLSAAEEKRIAEEREQSPTTNL